MGVVGQTNLSDIPDDVLERILQYHVLSGVVESTDLSDGQTANTLLSGESVTVGISGGAVSINTSNVTTAVFRQ